MCVLFCVYIHWRFIQIINMQRGQNKNETETSIYEVFFQARGYTLLLYKIINFLLVSSSKGMTQQNMFFFLCSAIAYLARYSAFIVNYFLPLVYY